MFFTNIGRVIAWLAFTLGLLRAGMLIAYVAGNGSLQSTAYLGRMTSGEAIDHALKVAACGLVLGILTEISRSVAKRNM